MFYFLLSYLFCLIFILFSVMFITLLERKILSYTQTRVGPNKVFFLGIIQPVLDGMKLLLKEFFFFNFFNKLLFIFGPFIFVNMMILIWFVIPSFFFKMNFIFSMVFFLCVIGLGVYINLLSGWSSNSKYSMIGAIRSMSQTVSYEICLSLMMYSIFFLLSSISMFSIIFMKSGFIMIIFWPVFLIWFISVLAECNRAPFDFAEGESELVSGFNTEFSSSLFALLFIGEYGMIMFFSIISCFIFFFFKSLFLVLIFFLMSGSILFIRSVFPRFRYDKLMFLVWFKFLPVTIFFCFFSIVFF